ncbi:hypothetical protein [Rhizobium sp. 18065]|uniref:hypothetical protein n=1 Tax=Rhizobium sp. 18065 TaxID=2681411 RepID=UPI00135A6FCF|nr:hypothetical protein [Rhizobium sp. 18065]
MQNDECDRYQDVRKQHATWYQAELVNKEIQEKSTRNAKGGTLGFSLFIVAVIFFKPIAEYCIELYNTAAAYVHGFL